MTNLELIDIEPPRSRAANDAAPAATVFSTGDGTRYIIQTLTNPRELFDWQSEWQSLADQSADANVFYEPWFLLPAAEHLDFGEKWQILLVQRMRPKEAGELKLCGFFPFVQTRGPGGVNELTLWKNQFCFLTSPLIDREQPAFVLRAVFDQIRKCHPGVGSLDFPLLAGEGPLHQGITEVLRESLSTTFIPDQYLRATSHCTGDVQEYLKSTLGGHHLREYRRQRRKLEGLGQLEYRRLPDRRALAGWIDWFLQLESQGWKARAGTAMQMHAGEAAFFKEMVTRGFAADKVQLDGLFLNGEPIAMKCNLLSPPVAFAFKIAFDEAYRKYSPGVLLEFEFLQQLADDPQLEWCDSCAIPGHQMIDRLWKERRLVRHLKVATGNSYGEVVIGALPFMRSLNRVRKRWKDSIKARLFPTPSPKN